MAPPPPSASLGLLNLGGCGVLLPTSQPNSSPGHGFLVPRRSVSVVPLSWGLVRRSRVLGARAAGFGAAGALANGEAGAGSSELRHIEKELTFSPTFTDYVKIMESVKLDRSKNFQGSDSDGRRRRFMGNGGDASVVWRSDRRSGDPRNKSFERKKGAQRDIGSDKGRGVKLAKNDSQKNVTRLAEERTPGFVEKSCGGRAKVEEYVKRSIVRGELSETKGNVVNHDLKQVASHGKTKHTRGDIVVHQTARNKHAQSNAWKDLQGQATSTVSLTSALPDSSIVMKNTKSMVKMGKENCTSRASSIHEHIFKDPRERKFSNSDVSAVIKFQRRQQRTESSERNLVVGRSAENGMDCNKPTVSKRYGYMQTMCERDGYPSDSLKHGKPEAIRMQRGENIKLGRIVRRDAKATEFDDRAAFKTFEVFTDVRNRPRVLQMEMEERIQKLASRSVFILGNGNG